MTNVELNDSVDLTAYLNRWVAIIKGRIAGVGVTYEQAYRAAKRMRPKDKADILFIDSDGQPVTMEQSWLKKHQLLQQTVEALAAGQIEAYLVGGAVRDLLLGRDKIVDFDFAVPDDGLAAARFVADGFEAAYYPLDPQRGTGRVVCTNTDPDKPGKTYLDFATFRGPSLEADLHDRDFTINAIALSLTSTPRLVDPFQGQQHLEQRRLQATSSQTFRRDPIRVLRAIRQAVEFDLVIEPQTELYLRQATSGLNEISPERQRDELLKLLNTPKPGHTVRKLHYFGVLPHLLPEVESMRGVTQSPPHHLDVFEHTATALDNWANLVQSNWAEIPARLRANVNEYMSQLLAGNLPYRILMPLALLFHDIGKPSVRSEDTTDGQTKIRFLQHERESARLARQIMNRLHFSSQATSFVKAIVAHHMRPLLLAIEGKVSRRAMYRLFRDTSGATFQGGVAVALHALADHRATYRTGTGQTEEQALHSLVERLVTAYFEQRDQVVDPLPLLTGRDLLDLGLSEGRLIGLLLGRLKEAQASGEVIDQEAALTFVKSDPSFASYQTDDL